MKGISPLRVLLLIATIALVSHFLFIGLFRAPNDDMNPTIAKGDFFLARNKPYKTHRDAKRGDIVLFETEVNGQKVQSIARVIGITGDKLELKGRDVILNGQALAREEVRTDKDRVIYKETLDGATYEVAYEQYIEHDKLPMTLEVESRYIFVLGDNRTHAQDSTRVGPIQAREGVLARKQ